MMHKIRSFVIGLLALLFITLQGVMAQMVIPVPPSPSLSGTVLNVIDGSPFKDGRVWILGEFSDSFLEVHTDKTGHYAVQLQEGYYIVVIGAGGYVSVCKNIWVLPGKPIVFSVRLSPDHENMIED